MVVEIFLSMVNILCEHVTRILLLTHNKLGKDGYNFV